MHGTATTEVYSVSLPALISQLCLPDYKGNGEQHKIWKEIPGLQTTHSTPLSLSGSSLAVGDMDKNRSAASSINLILGSG